MNKPQWNTHQNTIIFIHKNALENIVCEISAILSRGRWANTWVRAWHAVSYLWIACPGFSISSKTTILIEFIWDNAACDNHKNCHRSIAGNIANVAAHKVPLVSKILIQSERWHFLTNNKLSIWWLSDTLKQTSAIYNWTGHAHLSTQSMSGL